MYRPMQNPRRTSTTVVKPRERETSFNYSIKLCQFYIILHLTWHDLLEVVAASTGKPWHNTLKNERLRAVGLMAVTLPQPGLYTTIVKAGVRLGRLLEAPLGTPNR